MKLDRINFDHFMIEVKDIIKPEHIALLNPNMQVYYKLGHIYLALFYWKHLSVDSPCINYESAVLYTARL